MSGGFMVTLCSNHFCHVTFAKELDSSHTPLKQKSGFEFLNQGKWGKDVLKACTLLACTNLCSQALSIG